jgi:hypothetical protein
MPMPRSLGSDQVTLLPPMKIWPSEMSSRPAMQLSKVDLPQPEESEKNEELAFIDVEVERLENFERPEFQRQITDRYLVTILTLSPHRRRCRARKAFRKRSRQSAGRARS